MALIKQSTAYNRMVLMVAASDHVSGLAGLTLTVTSSKAGGAFASVAPVVTDRGAGWYNLALTAAMTDTLGDLAFQITATNADPTSVIDQVVALDLNVANVPANMTQIAGAAVNTAAAQLGVNVINVAGTAQTARNLGANLDVAVSSRLAPATAGRTLLIGTGGHVGIDWAAIANPTTAVNLSGTVINDVTVPAGSAALILRTGTAVAGAAATITLDAAASAVDNYYLGDLIIITGGTGVGQSRRVQGYVGATKVATLNRAWATVPDATSTFAISADDRVDVGHLTGVAQTARDLGAQLDATVSSRLAPLTAGRTLDVTAAGDVHIDWSLIANPTATVNLSGTTIGAVTSGGGSGGTVDNAAIAAAVWDRAATAIVTAGSIGLQLKTNIDTTISSRMATFGLPTNFGALSITAAGRVDVGAVSGTAQTARDLGLQLDATVSSRLAASSVNISSGVIQADLRSILGTVLTETTGQIAAAFRQFFNVATPTGTVNSLPNAPPGAANGLLRGGVNVATSFSGTGISATFTGSLTGSVASVTGAVGSVTGNVGGSVASVSGAVGSVTGSVGGAVGSVTARVTANVDQIGGAAPVATIRDAVFNGVIEGTTTLAEFMRGIIAALLGKAGGMATTNVYFRDQADTKNRVSATVDQYGNRTTVTTDLT